MYIIVLCYSLTMKQAQTTLQIESNGQGLYEFTHAVDAWLRRQYFDTGLLTLFCQHTSASLTIQENADPDVQLDLAEFFKHLVPENIPWMRHVMEGADDMPAHIKSTLTDVSLSIPISKGSLALGTWQGIYLFEHRNRPHSRQVMLHLIGE